MLRAIEQLPEGVLKSLMLSELSSRTGVDQARFAALLAAKAPAEPNGLEAQDDMPADAWNSSDGQVARGRAPVAAKRSGAMSLIARALQLLVHEPTLVDRLPESLDWCPEEDGDGALLKELVKLLRAGRYRSVQVLLAHFHGTQEGERLAQLARRELLMPPAARATELDGLVQHFCRAQSRQTPESEYAALLAKEKGGQRLSREEKQRLMELLMSLNR